MSLRKDPEAGRHIRLGVRGMSGTNKEAMSYEAEHRLALSCRQLKSSSQMSDNGKQGPLKVFELWIGAGLQVKRPVGDTKVEGTGESSGTEK